MYNFFLGECLDHQYSIPYLVRQKLSASDNKKMAWLLFTIGVALMNDLLSAALIFSSAKLWIKDSDKESKRHDFPLEQLQTAKNEWNKDRIKRIDFINRRLRQRSEARAYINNNDEAMLEYSQVFFKTNKIVSFWISVIRFICYSGRKQFYCRLGNICSLQVP